MRGQKVSKLRLIKVGMEYGGSEMRMSGITEESQSKRSEGNETRESEGRKSRGVRDRKEG